MKIGRIHDSIMVQFDPEDFLQMAEGGLIANKTISDYWIDYQIKNVGTTEKPRAGHWYYIRPIREPHVIERGAYLVKSVDCNGDCFRIGSDKFLHALGWYSFVWLPIHDMECALFNHSDDAMNLSPQKGPADQAMPTEKPVKLETPKIAFAAYSGKPTRLVYLKMEFRPTNYIDTVSENTYLGSRSMGMAVNGGIVRGEIESFVLLNGFGEYSISISDGNTDTKYYLFYFPPTGADNRFATNTDGYQLMRRLENCGESVCIRTKTGDFLWSDGKIYDGTGYEPYMNSISEAPGTWSSKIRAQAFLESWINQGRVPVEKWVLHNYLMDVTTPTFDRRVSVVSFDLCDAMISVLQEYPSARVVVVLDAISITIDKSMISAMISNR